MSDESKVVLTVELPKRAVIRNGQDKLYYIYEFVENWGWSPVLPLRGYAHSTSCYAKLGRMVSEETQKDLLKDI